MYEAKVASIGHMLWNECNLCKLRNMSYISYIYINKTNYYFIQSICIKWFQVIFYVSLIQMYILSWNEHFWASSNKKQKLVSINAIVLNVLKSQLFTHRIHTFTHTHAHSFLPNFSLIKILHNNDDNDEEQAVLQG